MTSTGGGTAAAVRFRGADSGEVERALVATAEAFRVTAEPVPDTDLAGVDHG